MRPKKNNLIKIVLVDDHPIVLTGIRNALSNRPEFEIVGEATTGQEAIRIANETKPHVVVMDISLPVMNGLEATKQIRKSLPGTQVLVLTMHENKEYVLEIIKSGAQGYLLKDSSPADLISAIETVHQGESFFSPSITQMLVKELRHPNRLSRRQAIPILTDRENDVLQLIAQGFTNKEIAGKLQVSIRTVQSHRDAIMKKVNLFTVAQLTAFALRQGLIEAP